jgi:hypothetical protein
VSAVQTPYSSQPVFDDRDRQRAHERLGAVDEIGADRLRDPLWPAEYGGEWPQSLESAAACRLPAQRSSNH